MEKSIHVSPLEFKTEDLIFDEDETKEILKFFFENDHAFIDGLTINDRLRGLAQGILVEAVDASYALGIVKIVYDIFYLKPPKPKMRKIFIKFGKKAAVHWFKKHVKATDLMDIKIYDCVRKTIDIKFKQHFHNVADDLVYNKPPMIVVAYHYDKSNPIVWR